jgi:hypothetical protein
MDAGARQRGRILQCCEESWKCQSYEMSLFAVLSRDYNVDRAVRSWTTCAQK